MVCNGHLLLYFYELVFGTNWGFIGYLHIQLSDLLIFEFYGSTTDTIKYIIEVGGSKSRSGNKGIPHLQWNLEYLKVYVEAVK